MRTTPGGWPRGRRRIYVLIAIFMAVAMSFAGILGVDIYLHGRFQKSAGFNVWGYRGPSVGGKRPDEYRVAVLGGSAAYGYGTDWQGALPAVLESRLANRTVGSYHRFRIVNLGYNNEGAYSFTFTMKDYAFLDYDAVVLYEGYNDLLGDPERPNLSIFRHESPVFRLTGYLPIFPIVFREKAAVLALGQASAMYRDGQKTVFHASVADRAAAGVLDATAAVGDALERQLGRVLPEPAHGVAPDPATGCKAPWQQYCRSILDAVEYGLEAGKQVLVATQPYLGLADHIRQRHIDQQTEMASMLARRFATNSRVLYVNLGPLLDLRDPALSFDHMHLTVEGNRRLAPALVAPVLALAASRRGDVAR